MKTQALYFWTLLVCMSITTINIFSYIKNPPTDDTGVNFVTISKDIPATSQLRQLLHLSDLSGHVTNVQLEELLVSLKTIDRELEIPKRWHGTSLAAVMKKTSQFAPMSHVPRIPLPSWEVFHEVIKPQMRPVIFVINPKMAESWFSSISDWCTLDKEVSVRTNYSSPWVKNSRNYETKKLADYCEDILHHADYDSKNQTSSDPNYMPPYAGHASLGLSEFKKTGAYYPPYFAPGHFATPALWFGPPGSFTPLHIDSRDNFATHYVGRKKWYLTPPYAVGSLEYKNFRDRYMHNGTEWGEIPDIISVPSWSTLPDIRVNNAGLPVVVADVRAGEILYLPVYWGHCVENVETSAMINFWIKEVPFSLENS